MSTWWEDGNGAAFAATMEIVRDAIADRKRI
jgi:hypothetical protein